MRYCRSADLWFWGIGGGFCFLQVGWAFVGVGFGAADFDEAGDCGSVDFEIVFGLQTMLDFGGGLAFVEPPGEDLFLVGNQTAFVGSRGGFLGLCSWHGDGSFYYARFVRNNV